MNFHCIQGYGTLSEHQKRLFRKVYDNHRATLSSKKRKAYVPIALIDESEERYFKVIFKNGDWLRYRYDGSWC